MGRVSKTNFFEGRNPHYNIASIVGGSTDFTEDLDDF